MLTNSTVFVLKPLKLSPSLIFSILRVELLLNLSLKYVPSGDGVGSSLDVITSTMPPNKGYIFKIERSVTYVLAFILDAYHPEVGLKSPKEVVNHYCVPCPIIGWRLERINY